MMKTLKTRRSGWNYASNCKASECLHWKKGILITALTAAHYAPSVSAQSDSNYIVLEEITVTARRRVEKEMEVPISMKVMNSEYLQTHNIGELNDLGTTMPSVRISTAGVSTNAPIITIRGQRPADVTLSLDQSAPIYFNEIVLTPTQGTNLAMYDLQSVQVLKGPQGTLFGRNSTGGAILITPATPGKELAGYAQVKLGDYNLYGFEGAVDLPVNDALQLRLAGRKLKRDGYQDNVADNALNGKEKYWDEDSSGVRLTLKLDLGGVTNLATLAYDQNEMVSRVPVIEAFNPQSNAGALINLIHNGGLDEMGFPAALLPGYNTDPQFQNAIDRQNGRDANEIESDLLGKDKIENRFFSNATEVELTDKLTFKNIFGYRDVDFSSAQDADGTALQILGSETSTTGPITLNPAPIQSVEAEQFSNEVQLIGDSFDSALEWITGAYWFQMKGTQFPDRQQNVGANPDWPTGGYGLAGFGTTPEQIAALATIDAIGEFGLIQISPAGDVKNEALGLFAEGTYAFNDQWSMTLGLRYSYDEREITVKNFIGAPTFGSLVVCNVFDENGVRLPNDNCARTESEKFEAPTWRTSLNFTPVDGVLTYGSISTGYRAGGFNTRGTDNLTLQPFDEETVITYELGNKIDWGPVSKLPLWTNLAVFYQEFNDIQRTQGVQDNDTGVVATTTINAAEAEISGVEFDITWAATQNLMLSLSYGYLDAKYNEWDLPLNLVAGAAPIVFDASDEDFTYIPRNTATLSASYTLPFDASLGEMTMSVNGYYQDEMNTFVYSRLLPEIGAILNWTDENLAAAQSTTTTDEYVIWNFRYDWRKVMGVNLDLAAYVNNVTDEEYIVGGLNVIDSLGISASTYGPPRTIGASLFYNF